MKNSVNLMKGGDDGTGSKCAKRQAQRHKAPREKCRAPRTGIQ
jgi:hypothetical protein